MKTNCENHDTYQDDCINCGLASVGSTPRAMPALTLPVVHATILRTKAQAILSRADMSHIPSAAARHEGAIDALNELLILFEG